jgi:hypothetical protein
MGKRLRFGISRTVLEPTGARAEGKEDLRPTSSDSVPPTGGWIARERLRELARRSNSQPVRHSQLVDTANGARVASRYTRSGSSCIAATASGRCETHRRSSCRMSLTQLRAASRHRCAQPQTPAMAQQQGITGNVFVSVALRADSSIASTAIFKSPSVILNPSSLQSAQGSIYQTEISNCRPIAATYSFIVTYDAYPRR